MRSAQNITGLLICPFRKLAFSLVVATVSASVPLAGLAQSSNGQAITAQSDASTSREQRSPVASSSSLDDLPNEPVPQGQQQSSRPFASSADSSRTQFNGGTEKGSPPPRFTRVLGIFPAAEELSTRDSVAPLSAGQKFEFFIKPTFDPSIAVIAVAGTLFSAKGTSQPAFGGGAAAYGQKAGAIAADYACNNLFARALLPTMLHQDPRFFRKQDGSVMSRFMYGISRPFVTRADDGHSALNISYLGGVTMTVALSNAYYPARNRNASDSAARYGEIIGVDAAVNVIREFLRLTH
jgi:hypothetical protein